MDSKDQKILEVAFRLFHQHGYRKVTMSDIAEAAGMSRPSLYAAFANKEAVFMAIAVAQGESCDRETCSPTPPTTCPPAWSRSIRASSSTWWRC